jgi:hypothetical protein
MTSCRLKNGFLSKNKGFYQKKRKTEKNHKKDLTIAGEGGNL